MILSTSTHWRTTRWHSSTRTALRELDKAWDRFGAELPKLAVPTLAVHGVNDPIAPIGAVRTYAEQIDPLQLKEFPGGRHDIINDTVHREVADAIVDFVTKHTPG